MATQKANPTAWNAPADWTGFVANIDEPVATPDGQAVSHTFAGPAVGTSLVLSGFFAVTPPAPADTDLVTGVDVTLRAKVSSTTWLGTYGSSLFEVFLTIGGSQRSIGINFPDPGTSYASLYYTASDWDDAWTNAELTAATLLIRPVNYLTNSVTFTIDAVDLVVTYEAKTIESPDEAALTLTGAAPSVLFKTPSAGTAELTGKAPAPIVSLTIPPSAGSLAATGKPSYVNSLQYQLQPNAWDEGWPTGFIANIDEPIANADGQSISTDSDQGLDVVRIDFDDVTGVIAGTDETLNIFVTVRARASSTVAAPYLAVGLYINDSLIGVTTTAPLSVSWDNYLITNPASWNQGWTVQELNTLQLALYPLATGTHDPVTPTVSYIDAIDVVIEYAKQSPMILPVDAGSLALTPTTATLAYLRYAPTTAGALALNEKTPTTFRQDAVSTTPDLLRLTTTTPILKTAFNEFPGVGSLAINEQATTTLVVVYEAPSAVSLTLTGKVPTATPTANHYGYPPRRQLNLFSEHPLVPQTGHEQVQVPRVRGNYTGQALTLSEVANLYEPAPVGSLQATSTTPQPLLGTNKLPAVGSISLSTTTAVVVNGTLITPTKVTLTATGGVPFTGLLPDTLVAAGQTPIPLVATTLALGADTLALTGQVPLTRVRTVIPFVGALALTGQSAPTVTISTGLSGGFPGLISLSVDYDIEFIATPEDILLT